MKFEDELNQPPYEQWKHEPPTLVGELISRYTFEGDFGPAEMLVIWPENSEVAYTVLCGKALLRSFIERRDPQVGGKVGIKYTGEKTSATGQTYATYNTAYEPPEGGTAAVTSDVEPPSGGDPMANADVPAEMPKHERDPGGEEEIPF